MTWAELRSLIFIAASFWRWYSNLPAERRAQFVDQAQRTFDQEKLAKTDQEYQDSAEGISDLITHL